MAEQESATELEARRHLERILDCELQRVTPDGRPSADYTFAIGSGSIAAVEVKELASPDWLDLSAATHRHETVRETAQLDLHWMILLSGEILAYRLAPMPTFPEGNEEQIATAAALGFITVRKAERVAKFNRRRDAAPAPIKIKGMIDDLIPDLKILEARGIRTTRGAWPMDEDLRCALMRIARRTRSAICMGGDARPEVGIPPGVSICLGYGSVRTGRADTIADRVEAWFETTSSDNLVNSLNKPEYGERHAALVFNSLEPELWSSAGKSTFVPQRQIGIPESIDFVWVVIGPRVLRYSDSAGWREF